MLGRRTKRKAALVANKAILQIKKQQQDGDYNKQNNINNTNGAFTMMEEQDCPKPVLFFGGSVTLPQEIMIEILDFLPKKGLVHSASLVCSSWNQATKHPDLWPVLDADIWKRHPTRSNGLEPPSKTVFPSMSQFFLFLRRPQFAQLKKLTPPDIYRTLHRRAFERLARACPSLEEMDLSGSTSIRYLALISFREELPRIPKLFPKLKKIHICMRSVQAEQLAEFARGMGDRLVDLSVRASHGRHDGRRHDLVDATLETLAEHCPNLEGFRYDFESDGFMEGRLTERGPMALIRNCTKLKYLHLTLPRATCPAIGQFVKENGYDERGLKLRLMFNVPPDASDYEDELRDSSDNELAILLWIFVAVVFCLSASLQILLFCLKH